MGRLTLQAFNQGRKLPQMPFHGVHGVGLGVVLKRLGVREERLATAFAAQLRSLPQTLGFR